MINFCAGTRRLRRYPASPEGALKMKFGVWYGAALWFLFLKGFHVQPFEEWSWWSVMVPIIWPTYPEIMRFLCRQGDDRIASAPLDTPER